MCCLPVLLVPVVSAGRCWIGNLSRVSFSAAGTDSENRWMIFVLFFPDILKCFYIHQALTRQDKDDRITFFGAGHKKRRMSVKGKKQNKAVTLHKIDFIPFPGVHMQFAYFRQLKDIPAFVLFSSHRRENK